MFGRWWKRKWGNQPPSSQEQRRAWVKIYPNLLKGLKIEIANQIWSTGITNILMARGFIHLPQLRKCSFTGSCASQINYVGDKILYWDLTGSIRTSWTTWDLKYEQVAGSPALILTSLFKAEESPLEWMMKALGAPWEVKLRTLGVGT